MSDIDKKAEHTGVLPRYKVYGRNIEGRTTGPAMAMFQTIEDVRSFRARHSNAKTMVLDGLTPIKL